MHIYIYDMHMYKPLPLIPRNRWLYIGSNHFSVSIWGNLGIYTAIYI